MMLDLIFAAGLCYAVDGDTLRCGETRVRLWGIDSPELNCHGKPRCVSAGSWDAKRALAVIINRQAIQCIDKGRDRYNRTVAQCYVGGIDIQCEMLKQGHAVEWLRFSHNYYAKCSNGRQKP